MAEFLARISADSRVVHADLLVADHIPNDVYATETTRNGDILLAYAVPYEQNSQADRKGYVQLAELPTTWATELSFEMDDEIYRGRGLIRATAALAIQTAIKKTSKLDYPQFAQIRVNAHNEAAKGVASGLGALIASEYDGTLQYVLTAQSFTQAQARRGVYV